MSDLSIHKPDAFSKDLKEVHHYLHNLLSLLDEMEIALYRSRQVYGNLRKACQSLEAC